MGSTVHRKLLCTGPNHHTKPRCPEAVLKGSTSSLREVQAEGLRIATHGVPTQGKGNRRGFLEPLNPTRRISPPAHQHFPAESRAVEVRHQGLSETACRVKATALAILARSIGRCVRKNARSENYFAAASLCNHLCGLTVVAIGSLRYAQHVRTSSQSQSDSLFIPLLRSGFSDPQHPSRTLLFSLFSEKGSSQGPHGATTSPLLSACRMLFVQQLAITVS